MRNGFGQYYKMCPGLVVMLRPSKFRVSSNEEFSIDTLSTIDKKEIINDSLYVIMFLFL